jgi:hypothetical protein
VGGHPGRDLVRPNGVKSRNIVVASGLLQQQTMSCSRLPLALLGAVLAVALSSAPAHAQPAYLPDAPPAPVPAPRVRTERYGFMLAAVDAAGFVTTVATEEPAFFAGSYLLAGPIVHLLHRNYGAAAGSLGLRAGLVLGGFLVGSSLSTCGTVDGYPCVTDDQVHGVLIGAGTALLLDWFWLARKTTREEATAPALVRAGSLRANPGVQMSRTGTMMLGLDGHF